MTGEDRRSERIQALIDEVDRIRRESERLTNHAERTMKRPFWPERRRSLRIPTSDQLDRDSEAR